MDRMRVQVIGRPGLFERWVPHLSSAAHEAGLIVEFSPAFAPETVDALVYAPPGGTVDLTPYTRARAALGLWAGVETVLRNPTLTIPYTRMVDEGLTRGMVEYVVGHVMRHHLGMDIDITRTDGQWVNHVPPLAGQRRVAMLGLGELGAASAKALAALGFELTGWARSPKSIEGVQCYSGDAGLAQALAGAEIVVLLLPATPETENTLNAETLGLLAKGAVVINPGRGALIDDGALLAALDAGQIGHATLDAFRIEPLPEDHPYWSHARVTVTPHIASETRPESASKVVAENLRRLRAGEPLLYVVDRDKGY